MNIIISINIIFDEKRVGKVGGLVDETQVCHISDITITDSLDS